jgi:TatA/E family protein of Tat protein translocase
MFGIGAPELIIIAIIALLIFGPSKLPELGKTIGKGLREFRNASSNLKDQINPLSGDDATGHTQLEPNNLIEDKESGEKKAAKRKTTKNIKTATAAGKKAVTVKPKKSTASLKSAAKKTAKPKN